jgi:hypothetical protein
MNFIKSICEKCVYCGTDKNLTVDHVPPQLLLPQPYPQNLITVPACFPCNQSFQKDDGYLRTMLCLDVRASKNSAAQSNLPAVLRSLRRANAKAFAEYLRRQAESSVILGQDGSPLGQVFELDKVRANRIGQRFIRALYFHETGTALPRNAVIRVACNMGLRTIDTEFNEICRVLAVFRDRGHGYIGRAFGYLAALEPESSAWLMQLYDFFVWLGTVDCKGCSTGQI